MSEITKVTPEQMQKLRDMQAKYIEFLKAKGESNDLALQQKPMMDADVTAADAAAALVFVVIKGHLTADLKFGSGQKVHFEGWPWGVGAFGGTGYGVYYGVDAATLIGGCHYHCQGYAEGVGGLQITCWRDNFGALGQINVAVAGAGVGETGGDDGQWTWA